MNPTLLSALQQARDSGELCSVYCDSRRPMASVEGFVDFIAHDSFLMRGVDSHGFYDGFFWRLLEDVYRVEIGGEYEQKITYLFRARNQSHPPFLPPLDVTSDLQRETLSSAQRQGFLVRVEILSKECRDGWVESVTDEILHLQVVSGFGHKDGNCLVELETLAKINCDNVDLQDAKLLTRWNELEPPSN